MDEKLKLKELTEDFISILEQCDEKKFQELWHPSAIRFGLGNANELGTMNKEEMIQYSINGLKNLKQQIPNPEEIKFRIDEIIDIKCIQDIIASVELKWQMTLPGSKGTHHTFINFAKDKDKWFIINVLDKGFESTE
ncbi:MAG: hypothetical protein FK733_05455 [Asgard group archaeon]|nr:hypothetical protein [Asgard group archaeon]